MTSYEYQIVLEKTGYTHVLTDLLDVIAFKIRTFSPRSYRKLLVIIYYKIHF